ncbi:MAG: hypothetical protein Tsb0014_44780 [Pleurocapsa sp.]
MFLSTEVRDSRKNMPQTQYFIQYLCPILSLEQLWRLLTTYEVSNSTYPNQSMYYDISARSALE